MVPDGLEVELELEHGTRFENAKVASNHPFLKGKIILLHLKQTVDYYQRIEVKELKG